MCNTDLKQVDKSEEFTAGQTILVRLCDGTDWKKKVFVRYATGTMCPYICENGKDGIIHWRYAKSI
jgi:hypothetical protein